LQNRLQGEQIAELEATIQSKDEENEQLKATIQTKDEEIELLNTKRCYTNVLQNKCLIVKMILILYFSFSWLKNTHSIQSMYVARS
jgi:hypothetical protein